jgi:Tol biopolymer transport system component
VQIEDGGWLNRASGDAYMAFSSTGAFAFAPLGPFSFENVNLSWIDRHGNMKPVLDSARGFFGASISPDGQKIVTTIQAANDDIWIYHVVRGQLTRLTFGGGNHSFPIWSLDGKYVTYIAEKGTTSDIFRKAWDGSGAEERLTNGLSVTALTSFTPDGKVAFVQNGDIWLLPLDGDRKPILLLHSAASEANAQFSPNGRWMAYNSNESGKDEVYVVPHPKHDGKWQVSTGGGVYPLWTRDGKELFYVNGSSIMVVQITGISTFDFSAPRKLLDLPPDATVADIAPNGQQFVVDVVRSRQVTQSKLTVVLEWFDELKTKASGARKQR